MTTKVTCELVLTYLMGQYREDRAEVFLVVLSNGQEATGRSCNKGNHRWVLDFFFPSLRIVKHWNSLDRGGATSTLGNAQNSTSRGPVQPAPSWPCSKAGVWIPELSSALHYSVTLGLLSPGIEVRSWAGPSTG